uniref:DNA-directed RNA polymerase subunit Rpo3 n=1 Tax=uncultured marine group II/III euryarchaeote KM3_172_D07 TaxID=1457928 RepID=A0A075GM63_9EURY|nr:DNA-directed RNA polymerase subunit D (rpoD) [uncultured marine group II/III euryarchaeote KM3_172_D07]
MTKLKVLSETDTSLRILFSGVNRAFLNSLRRTMIADVPKFAIDQMRVELGVFKNEETGELFESNYALSDEQLAHRFAMLPIPTFHDDFYFQDECPDCKDMVVDQRGCPSCQIIYTISSSGEDGGRSVVASEMNVIGDRRLEIPEAYGSIPLTKLYDGQVLHAYFYAIMGRGRDHAKYSPVSGVTFYSRQNGKINVKTRSKMLFDLNLKITAKDFNKEGILNDIDKVDLLRNDLNHVGSGTDLEADFNDAITLEDVEGEFIFQFETDGSMTARTCLEQACKELAGRFEALSNDFAEAL